MNRAATYLDHPSFYWIEMLRSEDDLRRRLACHALAEIGPAAPEARAALTAALNDPESYVRVWAAAGLAALDPENRQALLTLQEGMRDKLDFVRSLSAWHLGRLGLDLTGLETVLPGLRELLNDRDPNTRREAALALKKCRCPAASPRN